MSLGCPSKGYRTVFKRAQFLDRPGRREAAGVRLPANRSAYAVLKDDLKKETSGTTHSILRIASWIAKIGGSIKRKIPLRGVVDVIRDANSTVIIRVEIAVRTLSHQWAGCKKSPAEKADRDGSFYNGPHGHSVSQRRR